MKQIIFCLLLSLFSVNILGQNTSEEKPFIEVTGTAEKEIIPDEIYITITLRERMVNREKLTVEMQEEKLKNGLREIGIDVAKDLYLSDASADYVKVKWRTKDVITQKEYIVKTGNATMVGNVFKKLDEIGIEEAQIQRVNHSKMDSIKKSVRIIAIKAAKEKADYLLNAIGEQTAKPLIVRDTDGGNFVNIHNNVYSKGGRSSSNVYYVDGVKMAEDPAIQFQKIKVQSTVYVKFAIK